MLQPQVKQYMTKDWMTINVIWIEDLNHDVVIVDKTEDGKLRLYHPIRDSLTVLEQRHIDELLLNKERHQSKVELKSWFQRVKELVFGVKEKV